MHNSRTAQPSDIEINDVLTSIRGLIAQTNDGSASTGSGAPDKFPEPLVATSPDSSVTERIRAVIEQEIRSLEQSTDKSRVILESKDRADVSSSLPEEKTFMNSTLSKPVSSKPAQQGTGDKAQPNETDDLPANLMNFSPKADATRLPETNTEETNMMLNEINRTSLREATGDQPKGEAFDLFAATSHEDDDHLSGGNALRNLVRDVIRQELQGEMGQRISRNLRRAIRQEVTAAISAGLKTA